LETRGCSRYENRPVLCRLFPFVLTFNFDAVYLSPSFACPYLLQRGEGEPLILNNLLRDGAIESRVRNWKPVIDDWVGRYTWRRIDDAGGSGILQPTAAEVEGVVSDGARDYVASLPDGYPELLKRCEIEFSKLNEGRQTRTQEWNLPEAARDALAPSFTYISRLGLPGGPDGPVHVVTSIAGGKITCESAGYKITLPLNDLFLPFDVGVRARAMYGRYIDLLLRRHTEIIMAARAMAKVGGDVTLPLPALYMENLLILLRYAHLFLLLWGRLSEGVVSNAAMREVLGMADTFTGIVVGFRGISKVRGPDPGPQMIF